MKDYRISIIISTLNRSGELRNLLDSLVVQTLTPFEIIIIDQNLDDRLTRIVNVYQKRLPLNRVRTPGQIGVCRGRNTGWRLSSGQLLLFPDDDCWYPEDFIERAVSTLIETGADSVSGRSADETGRSINGRFGKSPCWVDRKTVWTTQIEWTVLINRSVLNVTGGFDESLGPGAGTPWGANEIQDLTLKAINAGFKQYYDPKLYAHHKPFLTHNPNQNIRIKGRSYARGMGRVLRTHGYGLTHLIYWALRPLACIPIAILLNRTKYALYQKDVLLGRIEGYFQQ